MMRDRVEEIKARLAKAGSPRSWYEKYEQDGELLPDGTGSPGDYEPTGEIINGDTGEVVAVVRGDGGCADGVAALIENAPEDLAWCLAEIERLRRVFGTACGIIERGDDRLLASDGPAGGQPPDLTLAEWRTLYTTLHSALSGDLTAQTVT